MNDILRTDVFVRHTPEAVACACIFLAARRLGIPLPRCPPWWEMFNVDDESVHEIALCLQRLYVREKPNIIAIETRLAEARKKQAEEREASAAAVAAAAAAASAAPAASQNTDDLSTRNSLNNSDHPLSNGVKSKHSPNAPVSETARVEQSSLDLIKSAKDVPNGIEANTKQGDSSK